MCGRLGGALVVLGMVGFILPWSISVKEGMFYSPWLPRHFTLSKLERSMQAIFLGPFHKNHLNTTARNNGTSRSTAPLVVV